MDDSSENRKNVVKEKSIAFAVRIVNLCKYLNREKSEYVLSKQILRSGTSIDANISESEFAISEKDFTSKLYISLKETSETLYWLKILYKTEYISEKEYESLWNDCEEIRRILSASTKTLKNK